MRWIKGVPDTRAPYGFKAVLEAPETTSEAPKGTAKKKRSCHSIWKTCNFILFATSVGTAPTTAQEVLLITPARPRRPPGAPHDGSEGLEDGPRETPKRSKRGPRSPQNFERKPHMGPQGAPKRAPEGFGSARLP